MLRGHHKRVERFRTAMLRENADMAAEQATVRTELLLATLNGLAFRWSLDAEFDFAGNARLALRQALQR